MFLLGWKKKPSLGFINVRAPDGGCLSLSRWEVAFQSLQLIAGPPMFTVSRTQTARAAEAPGQPAPQSPAGSESWCARPPSLRAGLCGAEHRFSPGQARCVRSVRRAQRREQRREPGPGGADPPRKAASFAHAETVAGGGTRPWRGRRWAAGPSGPLFVMLTCRVCARALSFIPPPPAKGAACLPPGAKERIPDALWGVGNVNQTGWRSAEIRLSTGFDSEEAAGVQKAQSPAEKGRGAGGVIRIAQWVRGAPVHAASRLRRTASPALPAPPRCSQRTRATRQPRRGPGSPHPQAEGHWA